MAITSTNALNILGVTQNITLLNPGQIENITYSGVTGFTYSSELGFTLSKADMALFYQYQLIFYNSLLLNFPSLNALFTSSLVASSARLQSFSSPNVLNYIQTTSTPAALVYSISYDRGTHLATFAARPLPLTITPQEYLIYFQVLSSYFNQVSIS